MGVIYHTPDPQQAINEVFRVLKPGGQAKIFLYRRNSLKVGAAKFLRALQRFADKVLSKERCFYSLLSTKKTGFLALCLSNVSVCHGWNGTQKKN